MQQPVAFYAQAQPLLSVASFSDKMVMSSCRLTADNVPGLRDFRGKRLSGTLMGRQVTTDAQNAKEMMKLCTQEGFPVYLPNGLGYSPGDGCRPPRRPASACWSIRASRPLPHPLVRRGLQLRVSFVPKLSRPVPFMRFRQGCRVKEEP